MTTAPHLPRHWAQRQEHRAGTSRPRPEDERCSSQQTVLSADRKPSGQRSSRALKDTLSAVTSSTVMSNLMGESTQSTIEVVDLSVVRGDNEILKSISFGAAPGELIGLLGPSGSGKTTLMPSLLGVQATTGGSARILGFEVGSPLLRGRIGYMAQGSAVYLDLSVEENLRYFAGVLLQAPSEIARVLDVVALAPFADRLVSSLSGGEQTRVSLGVALLGSPRALILDEPTVGLD